MESGNPGRRFQRQGAFHVAACHFGVKAPHQFAQFIVHCRTPSGVLGRNEGPVTHAHFDAGRLRVAVCRPVGEPSTRNLEVTVSPVAQFWRETSLTAKSFAKTVLGRKRVGRVQIKAEFTFFRELVHVNLNTV